VGTKLHVDGDHASSIQIQYMYLVMHLLLFLLTHYSISIHNTSIVFVQVWKAFWVYFD